jgi:hypothetical protein
MFRDEMKEDINPWGESTWGWLRTESKEKEIER